MIFYGSIFNGASLIREMTKISFWICGAFVLTGRWKMNLLLMLARINAMNFDQVRNAFSCFPSIEIHRTHP